MEVNKMKVDQKLNNIKLIVILVLMTLISGFFIFNKLNVMNIQIKGILSDEMTNQTNPVNNKLFRKQSISISSH